MTGTASTLDGESNLTFDGQSLLVKNTSGGIVSIQDTTNTGYLRILSFFGNNYIQSGTQLVADSKAPLIFGSVFAGTEWMRIDTSGRVGIGTATPIRKLDVAGSYEFFHNPITELSSNGGYGDVVTFGTGTLATFSCYYLASTSAWTLTDADAAASATGLLGIALGTSISTSGVLLRGYVENSAWNWATASAIYLGTVTSGGLTQTAPTGTLDIIRIVGYAISTNTIYFCPDNTWVEI